MAKYRKKPVVIEAMQFKLTKEIPCEFGVAKEYNTAEIGKFIGQLIHTSYEPNGTPEGNMYFEIETLEGTMRASLGDYVIKGIANEFYPCKPDIFLATYEEVAE